MRYLRLLALGAIAASTAFSTSASAQNSSLERLSIFGYLNQGFGVSGERPIAGLNRDPSTDIRAAAVQLRYALSPVDNFVVQAVTRSLGTSPLSAPSGTVALDWAFYHHRFDLASVRVGRMAAPFGFLAETRDVGTLQPFYRAPSTYYLEQIRSFDGVMATNEIKIAGGSLETSVFGGGTGGNSVTYLPPGLPVPFVNTRLRFERLLALQFVYTTPIEGIKVLAGGAVLRVLDTAKVQAAPATKLQLMNAGIEAKYDRLFARGEARKSKNGPNSRGLNYYAQAGVRPLDKLWINVQGEFIESSTYSLATNTHTTRTSTADRAISLSYQFAPSIVGKLERHWAHGGIDGYVGPNAVLPYAHYSLASFALSF